MKGYEVFNPDWTCQGLRYKVGKTYEEDVEPDFDSEKFFKITGIRV